MEANLPPGADHTSMMASQIPTFNPAAVPFQPKVLDGTTEQQATPKAKPAPQTVNSVDREWPALPTAGQTRKTRVQPKKAIDISACAQVSNNTTLVSPRPHRNSGIAKALEVHPMVQGLPPPSMTLPGLRDPLPNGMSDSSTTTLLHMPVVPSGPRQPYNINFSAGPHNGMHYFNGAQMGQMAGAHATPFQAFASPPVNAPYNVLDTGLFRGQSPPRLAMNNSVVSNQTITPVSHGGEGVVPHMNGANLPPRPAHPPAPLPTQPRGYSHITVRPNRSSTISPWDPRDVRYVPSEPSHFQNETTFFRGPSPRVDPFRAPQQMRPGGGMHHQHPGIQNMPYPGSQYSSSPFRSTPDTNPIPIDRRGLPKPPNRKRRHVPRRMRTDQGPMPSSADIYPDYSGHSQDSTSIDDSSWSSPSTLVPYIIHGTDNLATALPSIDEQSAISFDPFETPQSKSHIPRLMETNIPGYLRTPYHVPPSSADMAADSISDIQPQPLRESPSTTSRTYTSMGDNRSEMLSPRSLSRNSSVGGPRVWPRPTIPARTSLALDQLDGSRYGLRYGGLGMHNKRFGDVWEPPVLDGKYEQFKHLWDDDAKG